MTVHDRFLRMPEVEATTGLSRSTVYRRVKAGTFPPPIPLGGPHVVGWLQSHIVEWMDAQLLTAGQGLRSTASNSGHRRSGAHVEV